MPDVADHIQNRMYGHHFRKLVLRLEDMEEDTDKSQSRIDRSRILEIVCTANSHTDLTLRIKQMLALSKYL